MKKIIPIAVILLAVFCIASYMGMKPAVESCALAMLRQAGMQAARIGAVSIAGDRIFFRDIKLDADGFSTIGEIAAQTTPADIFMRRPFKNMTVSRLVLTGTVDENGKWDISGWNGIPPLSLPAAEITFDSAQLDLMTPAGAVRLEAKAVMTHTPEGVKFNANIWGMQYQLKLDAAIQGAYKNPAHWQAEITVNDGRINLENEQASRMNGWITVDATRFPAVLVGGQIDAGNVVIGETSLTAATITLDAKLPEYSLILKANAGRYENMTVALDVERKSGEETAIESSVTSASLDDTISFLEDIQASTSGKSIMNSPVLTPLLITEGNMSRLRREIESTPHDTLILQIHGPFSDLSGKITAQREKDGTVENRVFSLNPAH